MEIFEIPRNQFDGVAEEVVRTEFADGADFNEYLSEHYSGLSDNDLYIVSGVTELSKGQFEDAIQDEGWETDSSYGAVVKVGKDYGEQRAEAYLFFNPENQLFYFYTDQRKTEEINGALIPLLKKLHKAHYLYISPRILRQVTEKIAEEWETAMVTEFIAKRTKGTKVDSEVTPDQERTINYYSNDGLFRLREMEEKYGVLPHILEISIPGELTFRMNKEGVFKLKSGSLDLLFDYIEECIGQTLEIKKAYDSTRVEFVEVSHDESVSQSIPARIELTYPLRYDEIGPLEKKLKSGDYALIDTITQRGSVYFASKVYDQKNNLFFNVRADEDAIRVFPEEERNISTFFRFFEIVQLSLDDGASAAPAIVEPIRQ